jgi:endonuclease/exonuclease/phosphatase family metal-dependent hydrolase
MDNTFSVLTLNVRFGLAEDGPNNWCYRKKCFPDFFRNYSSDFIGLQEINDFQLDFVSGILPEFNFIGKRSPAPFFWQDNIIFYKKDWECIYQEHTFLSPTPMIPSRLRESRWPRQCTIGVFRNKSRTLVYINTHFDFDSDVQTKSAEMIMKRLSYLPSDFPVILMGDFNALPSRPCYTVFTGGNNKPETDNNLYFKNIFSEPYPGTHHGFTGNVDGSHIDWILYRGGVVLEEKMVIHDKINGYYLSDHYPVYAKFKWEKQGV